MKHSYIFACLMVVSLPGYSHCNKVKQLERQMQLLAGRQHLETITRQEDTANIIERLNSFEIALNDSGKHRECCGIMPSTDNQSKSTGLPDSYVHKDDLVRITKAFREEKEVTERLRRQVPEVTKQIESVKEQVELIRIKMSTKSESDNIIYEVESVKTEMKSLSDAFQRTSAEVSDAIDIFKSILEGMAEKIDRLSESVQTISGKFGKIETTGRPENMEKTQNANLGANPKYESCLSHYNAESTSDGVYLVYLTTSDKPLHVYCDMTTDGGGWTVFQRRKDGSVDFFRGWREYKKGFGNVQGEFWLGNDHIAALTSSGDHELRIELEDFDGNRKYAKCGKFQILPEADNYKLLVDLYTETPVTA